MSRPGPLSAGAVVMALVACACSGGATSVVSASPAPTHTSGSGAAAGAPSPTAGVAPTRAVASWSTKVGSGATVPAFGDGAVFLVDKHGYLDAFSARAGHSLWRARVPHWKSGFSYPVVSGGVVFTQTATSLSAFDESSGHLLWTQPRSDYRITQHGTTVTEVRSTGNVVASGGLVFDTSLGRGVIAREARTGAVLWQQPTSGTSVAGLATDGHGVYVISGTSSGPPAGFFRGVVAQAFRASDGSPMWTRTPSPPISVNEAPVVARGLLFAFSNYGATYAFDAATGAPRYVNHSVLYFSSAGVAGPVAYGSKMTASGAVVAVTLRTGGVVWSSHPVGADLGFPAVEGSVVVAGGDVLDAQTGRLIEVFARPGRYVADAAIGEGSAFVLVGNRLVAYRLP